MIKINKLLPYLILFILILSTIFLLYKGIGHSDTNEYTPLILREIDSTYLNNDWFVNINESIYNVRYYFLLLLKLFYYALPNLPLIYFILYSISVLLIGLSTYLISNHLFNNQKTAILNSSLVLLGATFSLGGNVIVTQQLVSSGLSLGLTLIGFYFILKKRLILFSVFTGLATLLHFTWGILFFGVIFISYLITNPDRDKINKYIVSILVYLLFILCLIPLIMSQSNTSLGLSGKQLLSIMGYMRAPHHYLPLHWSFIDYLEFLFIIALFLFSINKVKLSQSTKKFLISITIVVIILFFVDILLTEIIPFGLIIKFHIFRLSLLVNFISFIIIGEFIRTKLDTCLLDKSNKILVYILLFLSLFYNHLILISLPLFFIFKYTESKEYKVESIIYLLLISSIIISIFLLIFQFNKIEFLFHSKIVINLILKLMIIIPIILIIYLKNYYQKMIMIILLLIIISLFVLNNPPKLNYSPDKSTSDIYHFVKYNTPKNSIFIVPPRMESFRIGAQRAIVVDLKSFPFNEKDMVEWAQRMEDITHVNKSDPKFYSKVEDGYNSLTEEEIVALGQKYDADYIIFQKPKSLDLKVIYENEKYTSYSIS
ncbi:hypothetical protein COU57_05900 [Candidatus Pacearchaeota archaeon CG10_big_fil_rev_8_21_14_0_10_32_14]|nr:MAG: hypothetical protein COU57_05900 [Candidatus Pacearchaeota archaeon CG10_big_fil_rev_8_21_14_0_10_32_14]